MQPDQHMEDAEQLDGLAQIEILVAQEDLPVLPASPANYSDDEIPFDQLLGSRHDIGGGQSQQMHQDLQAEQNIQHLEPENVMTEMQQVQLPNNLDLGLAQPGQEEQLIEDQQSKAPATIEPNPIQQQDQGKQLVLDNNYNDTMLPQPE